MDREKIFEDCKDWNTLENPQYLSEKLKGINDEINQLQETILKENANQERYAALLSKIRKDNDKKNPILEMGINNGLMMAAERLLESNMSIDKVVILLRLDKQQEKILRMKYARNSK